MTSFQLCVSLWSISARHNYSFSHIDHTPEIHKYFDFPSNRTRDSVGAIRVVVKPTACRIQSVISAGVARVVLEGGIKRPKTDLRLISACDYITRVFTEIIISDKLNSNATTGFKFVNCFWGWFRKSVSDCLWCVFVRVFVCVCVCMYCYFTAENASP